MTIGAILMMVLTMTVITGIAGYYFWKVLITPNKSAVEEQGSEPSPHPEKRP